MNKKAQNGFGIVVAVIFIIVLIIGITGFDKVEASHKGVKVKLGEITGTMNEGFAWTGIFTRVHQYDLRTRSRVIELTGNNGAVDKDGQSIYATIEINYRLKPESVENAYRKKGHDNELEQVLRLEGIIKEGFKTITTDYSSLEIFQKREEVKDKAIEQKKVAEELAKAKEQEVQVNKFEANKKIETARGDAESAKLQAEADAYLIKVNAEAKAFETLEIAKAEAQALELKAQELTPMMIQNNWIDAWGKGGAQVPKFITEGAQSQFLMELPN